MYTGVQKYFNRFDELIMKPLFIFNYDKTTMKKVRAFHKIYAEDAGGIANSYLSKKEKHGSAVYNEAFLMD